MITYTTIRNTLQNARNTLRYAISKSRRDKDAVCTLPQESDWLIDSQLILWRWPCPMIQRKEAPHFLFLPPPSPSQLDLGGKFLSDLTFGSWRDHENRKTLWVFEVVTGELVHLNPKPQHHLWPKPQCFKGRQIPTPEANIIDKGQRIPSKSLQVTSKSAEAWDYQTNHTTQAWIVSTVVTPNLGLWLLWGRKVHKSLCESSPFSFPYFFSAIFLSIMAQYLLFSLMSLEQAPQDVLPKLMEPDAPLFWTSLGHFHLCIVISVKCCHSDGRISHLLCMDERDLRNKPTNAFRQVEFE